MLHMKKNSIEVNWDGGDGKRHTNERSYRIPFVSSREPGFKYMDDFLTLCKL